ncbi:hypothetical protein [Botrimarina hoheduenensis]|uniref:AsmA-like C-terminal domain-containing protein n=1 Tax=Botrimarina hoheduenensis TaxID=2528000 RepID=A0A5C5W827_9BACT|nr:hypothetical protein [Botrimarina hoheduenensis]TWT46413.1 hypothetical protein Pla111_15090 [Botrimarina hoheduenensis]
MPYLTSSRRAAYRCAKPCRGKTRRAKIRRGWLIALVTILGLLVAAPTLVATTAAHNRLLATVVPSEVGKLSAKGSVVGWTGPLALTGVELRDPDGELIASAERIEATGGWTSFIGSAPIALKISKPLLYATFTPAGSTLEALTQRITAARKPAQPPSDQPPVPPAGRVQRPLDLTLSEGVVRLADAATGERWQAEAIEARVVIASTGAMTAQIRGGMAPVDGPRGEFALDITGAEPNTAAEQRAVFSVRGVSATVLGLALRRHDAAARLAGVINGGGEMVWRPVPTAPALQDNPLGWALACGWRSRGEIAVDEGAFQGNASRGQLVRLKKMAVPWEFAAGDDRLQIVKLSPAIDFVRADLTGTVTAADGANWQQGVTVVPSALRGRMQIDLARLAALAPGVLSVRQGVQIDQGLITAKFDVARPGNNTTIVLEANSEGFVGSSPEGPLAWRTPIKMIANATGPPAIDTTAPLRGWQLQALDCQSRFLTAGAHGDATEIQGQASFDLAKLATDLGEFLDLGAWRLAGRGDAQFRWRQTETQGVQWSAKGGLKDLLVGAADRPLARERDLVFDVGGASSATSLTPSSARGELTAEGDTLRFELLPAAQANEARSYRGNLTGDLVTWLRRARLLQTDLPTPEALGLQGRVEASVEGQMGTTRGRADPIKVVLTDLVVAPTPDPSQPATLVAREPLVELVADAEWDTTTGRVKTREARLQSSTIALSARNLEVTPGAAESWRGEVSFRGDLARLSRWQAERPQSGDVLADGAIVGKATLRGIPEGTLLKVRATGENLGLTRVAGTNLEDLWREVQLEAQSDALLQPGRRADGTKRMSLELQELRINSPTLTGSVAGRIEDLEQLAGVRVNGGVNYDLERLSPVLWPQLADSVRLVGRDTARFEISSDDPPAGDQSLPAPPGAAGAPSVAAGAPGIERLTGRLEAPWQGADLFGLAVGPGKVIATLRAGLLRVDPIDVQIGDTGRLTTQAAARLAPTPRYAEVAPGPLVTQVAISQKVSERVLKYIAPVLADATRADGRFSIALAEARTPLDDPKLSRVRGVLDVHSVQVLPGPSIAEMVSLVRQIRGVVRDGVEGVAASNERPILTMSDRSIEFTMAEGRVYHRGLEFLVGDALVKSEGSVGIDETLDLLLQVPIQEEWIQRRPVLLGGLRGRSIDIPVRGTFKQPQIDRQAFQQISRELLQSAAAGAIDGLLRGLLQPR